MSSTRRVDPAGWISEHDPLPVSALQDPLYDLHGYDPRSDYVETYWLAILGPTAVLAARRLVDWLEERPEGLEIPLEPLARSLGISGSTARNAPLVRTLARLVDFGLARVSDGSYMTRTAFPPLVRRQVVRLPAYLAERHNIDLEGRSRCAGSGGVGVIGR